MSSKEVNFISDKIIYNDKKYIFNKKIKIEIKTTTTTVIQKWAKIFSNVRGHTCIAEPNLEVLSLT